MAAPIHQGVTRVPGGRRLVHGVAVHGAALLRRSCVLRDAQLLDELSLRRGRLRIGQADASL